ncbi:helix-turn-helix domain-containing protein [Streptomyces yaizuensis]|uniref:Scr1 family TA system antitoxin-like transcriptional regulator n=1 Tax=Streptomyces yaizuensis TaxID=2989713 RepID=A0ABQ5NVL7_9ACTN|nr:helix-turn-helix transcriptional regulator [Streptomyces sp. YSPA8]GLF94409.1 Scr1 family TA system antitoxin-like transcriptional regulator [Streptomyces sp. YSPA8]
MAEARPNVHRRRLGSALRSLRRKAGLSMEDAAERLGLSGKPPLSKIENGKQRVTGLGLTAFFEVYGVEDDTARQTIRAMATLAASGRRTSLLDEYREAIQTEGFEEYLHLEELSSKAEGYLALIPGLLQTREYALSIVERSQVWSSEREIIRFVELRMARQAVLERGDPLKLSCILDEAALRRVVGGATVMKAQLERLLEVADRHSHVAVQVLPFAVGAHASTDGSFQLLHFPAGPPVAVVEGKTTSLYLEEAGDVDRYQSAFESLTAQALDADESRRFIHELIKDCYT